MTIYSPTIETFPDGLKLLSVHRPQGKTFALALALGVGNFDDPPEFPGLAHFCEHLAFRGANKELAERLASLGVDVNGYTSIDHTMFTVRGHVDFLPLAAEFMANVLCGEPRSDEDVAEEREIIRHEYHDDDESRRSADFNRHLLAALGDPNWNVSQRRLLSRLKRLSATTLNAFRREHYRAGSARLAYVGPVGQSEIRHLLGGQLQTTSTESPRPSALPARKPQIKKRLVMCVDASSYVWLDFTYITSSTKPSSRFAAEILADLIGRGPHSILFRQLRTENQLAYSVSADYFAYRHCSGMHWDTAISRWALSRVLDAFLECERRFVTQGITSEELESAKSRLTRWFELHIDYPEHLADYLAYESLRSGDTSLAEPGRYLSSLASLSLPEINEAAAELLSSSNRVVFVGGRVGPWGRFLVRRKLAKSDRGRS